MNLSVKWKLTLLFSILLLISILSLGGYATVQMEKEVLSVVHKQLTSNLKQTKSIMEQKLPGAWAIEAGKLTKGGKVLNDNFDLIDGISQTIGNSIKITLSQGDTRVATNIILKDGTRAVGTKVSDAVKQVTLVKGAEYLGEATVVDEKYQAIYDPILNQNKEIIGLIFLGVPSKVYSESIDHFAKGMIQIGLIGLIIILGLVYLVAQQSTKLLKRITRIANNIASGNLKNEVLPVKSKDEFGQLSSSMNSMVLSLQQMIHKVNESVGTLTLSSTQLTANVEQTTDTADQVTRTMQDMSIGADQQVKTTAESAKAAEEMTAGIQRIAESTAFVHEASFEMVRKAEAGNTTIQEAVSQINITGSSLQSMSDEVRGLNELLQQIGQMATVIRTISAQTNILSLNAAIEAARAGEQGKGFAVVAAEVRKLAEGTGSSAEQISELIERIQFASEKVVITADRGLLEVNKGIHLIHNTGEVLQVIVDTSRSVNNQIEEVSAASEQMSAGTEEIASSIQEISNIAIQAASAIQTVAASTEEQLASMEQISVSSEVLHQLAEDLKAVIARYNQ